MKAVYISALAALAGIAVATPTNNIFKRRPGAQCDTDGKEPVSRAACDALLKDLLEPEADEDFTIGGGTYSFGCDCRILVTPKDGNEITLRHSVIIDDVKKLMDSCTDDGNVVGTWSEPSGALARRTEIMKYAGSIC